MRYTYRMGHAACLALADRLAVCLMALKRQRVGLVVLVAGIDLIECCAADLAFERNVALGQPVKGKAEVGRQK